MAPSTADGASFRRKNFTESSQRSPRCSRNFVALAVCVPSVWRPRNCIDVVLLTFSLQNWKKKFFPSSSRWWPLWLRRWRGGGGRRLIQSVLASTPNWRTAAPGQIAALEFSLICQSQNQSSFQNYFWREFFFLHQKFRILLDDRLAGMNRKSASLSFPTSLACQ